MNQSPLLSFYHNNKDYILSLTCQCVNFKTHRFFFSKSIIWEIFINSNNCATLNINILIIMIMISPKKHIKSNLGYDDDDDDDNQ